MLTKELILVFWEHIPMFLARYLNLQTCLIFLLILLLAKTFNLHHLHVGLPPGPSGYPIMGYLPNLTKNIHLQLTDLAKQFGSVYKLYFGRHLVVVLSDAKVIREAFKTEAFSGRPNTQFTKLLDGYGIINSDGALWKNQRKFLHTHLRRFGMRRQGVGRDSMEQRIQIEVEDFLSVVNEEYQTGRLSEDTAVDLSSIVAASVTNVISSVLMSVRYKPGDTDFQRFMHLMDEGFRLFTIAAKVNVFPILRFLPRMSEAYEKLKENKEEMHGYFRSIIDQHRQTFNPQETRDLVDAYLLEFMMAKEENREDELFYGKDPDRQLCQIMSDLFSAGQETVKTTLQWGILFMLHNPDIQGKIQEELDAVVGRKRLPTLTDAPFMPYTEATICEILRRSNVAGLGTTHATTCDVKIDNHFIPKDTQILPLLWAVHMDPNLWEDPEKFDPSRFINESGKVQKPEYFMPFGIGRRMCLGDVLAKMEIFMFFTSLLHSFTLIPDGDNLPNLDAHVAATIAPSSYKVRAKRRDIAEMDFQFSKEDVY